MSAAHPDLQDEPAHTYGEQAVEAPATQVPVPLQVLAATCVAVVHDPDAQTVPETYLRHPPAPSQVPSVPHEGAS